MTYTYALVDVSPSSYAEVKAVLLRAGYEESVHRDAGEEVLDMRGLALRQALPVENTLKHDITVLLSQAEKLRDRAGRSAEGRNLSILCTELQKVKAFIGYEGL